MDIARSVFRQILKASSKVALPLMIRICLLAGGVVALTAAPSATQTLPASAAFVPSVYQRFEDWKTVCDRLPSNRALKHRSVAKDLRPLKDFAQFDEVLEAFFAQCKSNGLARADVWLGQAPAKAQFLNTDAAYFARPAIPFQPFVQRLMVPENAEVFYHGDFHGDIHSLVTWLGWLNSHDYLHGFRFAKPDAYMVLLGDYTDRGAYSVEVLYTLLRLKIENPDRVVLVRGNHEDVRLAATYGFLDEAANKYGRTFNAARVMRLYDFLPVVLYLGCRDYFIESHHGGMEPGFNPGPLLGAPDSIRFQFLGRINQAQFLKEHPNWLAALPEGERRLAERALVDFTPESPTTPSAIGFMWNDFSIVRGQAEFAIDPGRAYVYGERATRLILEQAGTATRHIRAVFRAHQHSTVINPMMRRLKASQGIFRHWQEGDSLGLLESDPVILSKRLDHAEERRVPANSVWTFNVVPDSLYGDGCDFSFDTFGILTVARNPDDWRLRVVNVNIPK